MMSLIWLFFRYLDCCIYCRHTYSSATSFNIKWNEELGTKRSLHYRELHHMQLYHTKILIQGFRHSTKVLQCFYFSLSKCNLSFHSNLNKLIQVWRCLFIHEMLCLITLSSLFDLRRKLQRPEQIMHSHPLASQRISLCYSFVPFRHTCRCTAEADIIVEGQVISK